MHASVGYLYVYMHTYNLHVNILIHFQHHHVLQVTLFFQSFFGILFFLTPLVFLNSSEPLIFTIICSKATEPAD